MCFDWIGAICEALSETFEEWQDKRGERQIASLTEKLVYESPKTEMVVAMKGQRQKMAKTSIELIKAKSSLVKAKSYQKK